MFGTSSGDNSPSTTPATTNTFQKPTITTRNNFDSIIMMDEQELMNEGLTGSSIESSPASTPLFNNTSSSLFGLPFPSHLQQQQQPYMNPFNNNNNSSSSRLYNNNINSNRHHNNNSTSPISASSEPFQSFSFIDDEEANQTTSDSGYLSGSSHLSLTPPGLSYMMMSMGNFNINCNSSNPNATTNNNTSPPNQQQQTSYHNINSNNIINNNFPSNLSSPSPYGTLLGTGSEEDDDILGNGRVVMGSGVADDVEALLDDENAFNDDLLNNASSNNQTTRNASSIFQQQLQQLQQLHNNSSPEINPNSASTSLRNSFNNNDSVTTSTSMRRTNSTQNLHNSSTTALPPTSASAFNTANAYNMALIEEMMLNGALNNANALELQQALLRSANPSSNSMPSIPSALSTSPPSTAAAAFQLQQQNLALSRQLVQQQQVVASMIGSQMRSLQVVQELMQQQQQERQTKKTTGGSSIPRSKTMPSLSNSSVIPISMLSYQQQQRSGNQKPLSARGTSSSHSRSSTSSALDADVLHINEEDVNFKEDASPLFMNQRSIHDFMSQHNSIELDAENHSLNPLNLSSVELYNTMMNTLQQNQKLLANAYGNLANLANTLSQQQSSVASGMKRSTSTTSVNSVTSTSSQHSGYQNLGYSSIPFSPMSRSQSMNCLSSLANTGTTLNLGLDSTLSSFGENVVNNDNKSSSGEMKRSVSTNSLRNLKRSTKSKKMAPTRSSDNLSGLLDKELEKESSKKRKNSSSTKKTKKNHSDSNSTADLSSLQKSAQSEETSVTEELPTNKRKTNSNASLTTSSSSSSLNVGEEIPSLQIESSEPKSNEASPRVNNRDVVTSSSTNSENSSTTTLPSSKSHTSLSSIANSQPTQSCISTKSSKQKSVKIGGVIGGVRKAHSMDSIAATAQQYQFTMEPPPTSCQVASSTSTATTEQPNSKTKSTKTSKSKKIAFQNDSPASATIPGAGMFSMSSYQPPSSSNCNQGNKRWKFHEFDNEDKPIKDGDSGFTFHFYKPSKN
ncbi:hypothetical protein C9374_011661 [Naegleria lovaniensis]|uniref:Uncharacterized protein n=1 Tax=Naegleria lovaniensis TaxID=51637 RepID=A0AA88GH39_NAELO|nr:uncharacterized protein C9374_011661 [Naegleria lovaniensis]KAG2373996.1 hypothetical protein C9374_011661 [Naegleria lovaniensis]